MKIEVENSVVGIEYTLTEAGGSTVVDSNKGAEPLVFITGKANIIPGLEKALIGMSVGECGDIMVKATDAYGEINKEAFQTIPRDQFEGIDLVEGMMLYGQGEHGETVQVMVKSFTDTEVNIDFNHPLAGKDLMFNVTILSVREATADESMTGHISTGDSCGTSHSGGCCGGGHCH